MIKEFLTTKEISYLCSIPRRTVIRYCKIRKFKSAVKRGGAWFVQKDDKFLLHGLRFKTIEISEKYTSIYDAFEL